MLLHHAPAQYPARAAAREATGSRRVYRQSCSPVDPAQYQPSIPPVDPAEQSWPVNRTHPVSHQSCAMDPAKYHPAKYPAEYPRVARQWLASGSRRVSHQNSPPVYPRVACLPSIPSSSPEYPAEYPRAPRQWIPPSIPLRIPYRCPAEYPARSSRSGACQYSPAHPGTQLGLHFMLVPSCFEGSERVMLLCCFGL